MAALGPTIGSGTADERLEFPRSAPILTIALYCLLLGSVAVASLRWPSAALAGIICTFGIEQWAQSNNSFFWVHGTLTNYVTGGILSFALLVGFLRGKPLFSNYPAVGWVAIGLFVFSLMSAIWSVSPGITLDKWRSSWPYITTILVLSPLLIIEPRDLQHGFYATLALGTIILLLLLFTTDMVGRHIQLQTGTGIGNLRSFSGNPLAIASLAGHVTLIAILMNFRGVARVWHVARWLIVAVGLVISVKSGSRGQLFALLVTLLVFFPLSRRIQNVRGFAAGAFSLIVVIALAAWAHAFFAQSDRWAWDSMVDAYTSGRVDTSIRLLQYWAGSFPLHWLIGLGNSVSSDPFVLGGYPHVVLTEVLAEEGLIGFAMLWAVVILGARAITRSYPLCADFADARGVLAVLGGLFLFEVILSFKQGSLLGNNYAFAFAIMLGKFETAAIRLSADEPQLAGDPSITIAPAV